MTEELDKYLADLSSLESKSQELHRNMLRFSQTLSITTHKMLYDAMIKQNPELADDNVFLFRIAPVVIVPDNEVYEN